MSQTNANTCECNVETITFPIRGLSFEVDKSVLGDGGVPMGDMPNLQIGVETKRNMLFNGKQVYSQMVNFGALPNKGKKTINHPILDVEWIQVDPQFSYVISPSGYTKGIVSAHASLVGGNWDYGVNTTQIMMSAGENRTSYTAVFCLNYTKTTD